MAAKRLEIDVTFEGEGGATVARLSGDLDLVTADEAKRRLSETIDAHPRPLQLELADMGFIDSTGLGTLVAIHHHAANAGVPVTLAGVSSQVRRVMQITRLDELFEIR